MVDVCHEVFLDAIHHVFLLLICHGLEEGMRLQTLTHQLEEEGVKGGEEGEEGEGVEGGEKGGGIKVMWRTKQTSNIVVNSLCKSLEQLHSVPPLLLSTYL